MSQHHAARLPLRQVWPDEFVERYRAAGYWRGETMPGFLRERARECADRTALVAGDARYTYAELWQEAERIGAGLLALGLTPGDRVLVQFGNVAEFIPVVCGLFRAGLIPVYTLPAHRLTELVHFARKAEASAYITAARHEGFDHRTLARALRAEVPAVANVIIAGDAEEFTSLAALAGDHQALPDDPDPQSVAFLQISGGSTGLSKLIPRTHDDYIYSFRASNEICGIDRESVYLVALPAAHNFPASSPGWLGALYAGARVVLSPGPGTAQAFPLIEAERVTCVGLVPPLALLWADAAKASSHDLSSLQVMQVGGAKLVPEAARRLKETLDCQLQQVFGMAEGLVNYTRLDDREEIVLQSQGRPISPDDEVLIVDDHGDLVPEGSAGHLLVRGPYTIRGYHNDDGANARSFTDDGFYRTGDVVQRLAGGYLVVQGRATDHINRAGEKISAEEIEDHLLAHPAVFDAAVVSIPDAYLGERSCAFVIARAERPRAVELKRWVRERGLAAFKVPDQVVFVDAFGTTAVGKVSRRELRAHLRERFVTEQQGGERNDPEPHDAVKQGESS
ncbi:(2,3-dihydroxybenzoyl)adenylate synthase [Salinicola rhizosphaerae]|uniref:2,3-dihydroxybenzoate-AMP ligase n=1 Tax=Salinicola rhizosphaerae TaxID=1443141 RepID=A0ABQ3E8Z4_9GAMM|nr:AMP-binding protein [Salinicola rhizosphaerae]GHB28732.1 2,3-dihydroxybenzoate-AMP ligase [Salinicola rhizosphaerae]